MADNKRFNFTIDTLKAVQCPPSGKPDKSGRTYVYDAKVNGLALCVTESGARTFYVVKKISGKPVRIRLAPALELTVEQARKLANDKLFEISSGANPQELKVAAREAATLGDMWATYRADVKKGQRTMGEDLGLWNRYLSPWAKRRVKTEITVDAVRKLYNKISAGEMGRTIKDCQGYARPVKGGATAANRTMALLSGMFSKCGRKFGVAGFNPCGEISKVKERPCKRYLSEAEMPAFWNAMGKQSQTIQDLVKLALFTGQRRWTLFTMRWDEINLNFKAWTIPADKMKSGEAHVIPLVPEAMEILTRRRKAAGDDAQWVLNAPSETGHIEEPKKALKAIWKAAGIPAITLHDLRRTCATWANSTGASLSDIAAVLAHVAPGITGIYARATEDAKRLALERSVQAIITAATGAVKPKGKRTRKPQPEGMTPPVQSQRASA